jgi:hypothetical protein
MIGWLIRPLNANGLERSTELLLAAGKSGIGTLSGNQHDRLAELLQAL